VTLILQVLNKLEDKNLRNNKALKRNSSQQSKKNMQNKDLGMLKKYSEKDIQNVSNPLCK
jgi:uncharacterized protein YjaZ